MARLRSDGWTGWVGRRCGLWLCALLIGAPTAMAQTPFAVTSTLDAASIAGRPVALDAQGKLLPWPMPDSTGYSYSSHVLSQWTILWDQYNRQRLPYFYCCFAIDRTSFELTPDRNWANSTGYLRAMMTGFVERLYPYTGDARTLTFLRDLVDYELQNGLTPESYVWAGVPYPSADPGSARYTGWSAHGVDYVEPHVVGADGYAYVRLYEMTGAAKYLYAAIRCADALAKNYKIGSETFSPWPDRVYARDGQAHGNPKMFAYSANVVEPIMLFDELIRLHQGDAARYAVVRRGAWDWLMRYPMKNNVWAGYFEDVPGSLENVNQVIPLEFARYVLLHPELDSDWRRHAQGLIDWVKTTPKWPKYRVHGATVTTEQGDGKAFCCNGPNQCCDSHSARLAAVEAFYYARTGDAAEKEEAYRTYNWVTYWQGLPGAHAPFSDQWWFTDEFADGPRRMMDAFWAVPEWAPEDESHLLGSGSVITRIAYRAGAVSYSTFDADSTEVLRLDFSVRSVAVDGRPLARLRDRASLEAGAHREGYVFDDRTQVLYIRHADGRDVDVEGDGGERPPSYVTFDDPHLPAGTVLNGAYPSGVIDWGQGSWKIGAPLGRFGTFNLALAQAGGEEAAFTFLEPSVLVGLDAYNDGDRDAVVTLGSKEAGDLTFVIRPKELRRLRTGWRDPGAKVQLQVSHGEGLRIDNLAYLRR
jgi:hypothetical protein